jgi:hypothetical protein
MAARDTYPRYFKAETADVFRMLAKPRNECEAAFKQGYEGKKPTYSGTACKRAWEAGRQRRRLDPVSA